MNLVRRLACSVALCVTSMSSAFAQAGEQRLPVPWGVGERSEYEVKFGKLRAGSASMEVVGLQDVRGRETWHTALKVNGGIRFLYNIEDTFESWFDSRTGNSLRFHKDQNEGRHDAKHLFEIFPDRATYLEGADTTPKPSVKDPLDDGSFLYFIRTVPLVIGRTYSFDRYYRPDRNPVTIVVLRKDTIEVADKRWPAIVVQPVIKTPGIFSENGHAEVWLSDDPRHIVLQLKSGLTFGSINLYLTSYKPAP